MPAVTFIFNKPPTAVMNFQQQIMLYCPGFQWEQILREGWRWKRRSGNELSYKNLDKSHKNDQTNHSHNCKCLTVGTHNILTWKL